MTKEELIKLYETIERPLKISAESVELLDEAEPDGPVVIKDKNECITMMMTRSDYEALKLWGSNNK